nr:MAG TPA: hypothetical protein [Caudoviricetes sp.]
MISFLIFFISTLLLQNTNLLSCNVKPHYTQ